MYAEEALVRSYNYAVKAYQEDTFTVTITFQQAAGQASVYLTDEDGNRLPGNS